MSDFLWPSGLKHTTLPCPSPSPRVCLNSCLFSQWCHPVISSSVVPFSCPQPLPASGSSPMSQLFAPAGQSTDFQLQFSSSNEHSVLVSFGVDWLDLLAAQGTLKSLPQHRSSKASILQRSAFFVVQLQQPTSLSGTRLSGWVRSSSRAWAPRLSSPGPRASRSVFLQRVSPVRALVSGRPGCQDWTPEALRPAFRACPSACTLLVSGFLMNRLHVLSLQVLWQQVWGSSLWGTPELQVSFALILRSLWSYLQHVHCSPLYWLASIAISNHRRLAGLQNRRLVARFLRPRWQQRDAYWGVRRRVCPGFSPHPEGCWSP